MEKRTFTKACLSDVKVFMMIMHVPLIELMCQVVMGWIPALKYLRPDARGDYGHVLSCQVVNYVASRDHGAL
jgi:hypothetical protein